MGARAGGSDGGNVTSGTADGGGRGAAMGRKNNTVGKREAAGVGNVQTPGEWGETLGGARPPEWTPIPEVNGVQESCRHVAPSTGTVPQPCGHNTWREMTSECYGHLNSADDLTGNTQFQLTN